MNPLPRFIGSRIKTALAKLSTLLPSKATRTNLYWHSIGAFRLWKHRAQYADYAHQMVQYLNKRRQFYTTHPDSPLDLRDPYDRLIALERAHPRLKSIHLYLERRTLGDVWANRLTRFRHSWDKESVEELSL